MHMRYRVRAAIPFANMHLAYEALSDGMKAMLVDVKTWCVGDRFKKTAAASELTVIKATR